MYDHDLFVRTTAGFTEKLLSHYDLDDVLSDMGDRLMRLFALAGSGVTLVLEGRLHAVTAVPPIIAPLERYQEEKQEGPCNDAYRSGEVVAVSDLMSETRWPGYRQVAGQVGMRAVVGVPMRLADRVVGALNMYHANVREWTDDDLVAARVLANMATAYLINASSLSKQAQLAQQLQQALDTRVVIEQAKGVLAEAHRISMEDAFERMRRHARNHNVKVHLVARAVVGVGLRL